ncbi:hypothetical protein BJ912DRAFT_177645 [Pholiota molesta]|nr:hypothetical protein BJ912DRAFT_177645 [Pholiota molesta]
MIYDKSYLFSSAPACVWLHPFRLIVRFLDRAVRPASVARQDGLICALDCGNGSRTPVLASFCFPNGLRKGGKRIGCVVDHPSLALTLPVIVSMGFFQEAIETQVPLNHSARWALWPHCQSAGSNAFARSSDWVGFFFVVYNHFFVEAIVICGRTFGGK